jgi:hypothetical protein
VFGSGRGIYRGGAAVSRREPPNSFGGRRLSAPEKTPPNMDALQRRALLSELVTLPPRVRPGSYVEIKTPAPYH